MEWVEEDEGGRRTKLMRLARYAAQARVLPGAAGCREI